MRREVELITLSLLAGDVVTNTMQKVKPLVLIMSVRRQTTKALRNLL